MVWGDNDDVAAMEWSGRACMDSRHRYGQTVTVELCGICALNGSGACLWRIIPYHIDANVDGMRLGFSYEG